MLRMAHGERGIIMMHVKKFGLAAAVFAASSLLVTGCGGKTADRAPGPGALQGTRDLQNVITTENFASIRPGMTLGDVEAMYGKGAHVGKSIVNGVYTDTYEWQDGTYKIVTCTFAHENRLNNPLSCPALVEKEIRATDEIAQTWNGPVTKENYATLAYGMNLVGARHALGADGTLIGESAVPGMETQTYGWAVSDGRVARVTFQDDKLIAMNLDNALPAYRKTK